MTIGIYEIYCTSSGQRYIGSSKNIEKRWQDHITMLEGKYHHNFFLQRAWNAYGRNNFFFSLLEKVENENDLFKREEEYIKKFKFYDLYNVMKKPGQKPRKTTRWTKEVEKRRKAREKEEYAWGN